MNRVRVGTQPENRPTPPHLGTGRSELHRLGSSISSTPAKNNTAPPIGKPTVRKGATQKKRSLLPIYLLLATLFIPWLFSVGSAVLTVYRLVLLIMVVPCLVMWLSGKAGKIRIPDIALLLFSAWCALSIIVIDGFSGSLEPIVLNFLETMCPYLLARCYIRTAEEFYAMVSFLFKCVLAILPFAIIESVTNWNIAHDLFAAVLPSHPSYNMEPRWGLRRAQTVFEHPILFGVSTGGILALVHVVLGYQKSAGQRFLKSGLVALTSFMSLSAGPMSAMLLQTLLLTWNWIMGSIKARWKILWGIFALIYLVVAVGSNQSVAAFFIGHFSFDSQSGYFRVLIWTFGSQSVMNHPWFGVSYGEWDRPEWMPPSIDMFWLIYAVRHGLPAGLLLFFGFASACFSVASKQGLDDKQSAYRLAYLVSLTGFFLVGWTVYFWNATYVLFTFLIGSGMWLLDVEGEQSKPKRSHALTVTKPVIDRGGKISNKPF